jgi:S-adenosylmethionine:tRNA ribosyltransferase-isomerase
MQLEDLHYDLPPELIAQQPCSPRDAARLLVLDRASGRIEHRIFRDVGEYLRAGDCLVLNDTRVLPARFFCRRASGGRIEGLFLDADADGWRVLLRPSARLRVGERLTCEARRGESQGQGGEQGVREGILEPASSEQGVREGILEPASSADGPSGSADGSSGGSADGSSSGSADGSSSGRAPHRPSRGPCTAALSPPQRRERITGKEELELLEYLDRGAWRVRPLPPVEPLDLLNRIGEAPLPPYIRRPSGPDATDHARYQTIYAERPGAVAAPTAGLHFTPGLLTGLEAQGVRRAAATLHVGLGTFAPIETRDLAAHRMHAERFRIDEAAAGTIAQAKASGGRVVAVGTTTVRALESFRTGPVAAGEGATDLFIHPPFEFRHVDRLITNFHLPGSTLLALVSALAGVDRVRAAYAEAIAQRYRFYSYGDAMLIL